MSTTAEIQRENDEAVPVLATKPIGWLGVRPRPKVSGRYQPWDIIDSNGRVVRPCTDLFDAMMWIQQHFAGRDRITSDLQAIDAGEA